MYPTGWYAYSCIPVIPPLAEYWVLYIMWEWVGKLHVYGADTNVILEVSETSFMGRSV